MSIDELKAGFSRLAEDVVSVENPHSRLMIRRRKRFRTRLAIFAIATAAMITGGLAAPAALVNVATEPEDLTPDSQILAESPYVDRLVNAAPRGNLSGDAEYVERVEKASEQAKEAGIDGVPCFILGGQFAVSGAQDPAYLADAIGRAAKERQRSETAA